MKLKLLDKITLVLILGILINMNFYGMNFATSLNSTRVGDSQPYNSFKNYIWGGTGDQEDAMFGWNVTFIENFNGDSYPDLVVSTPWYDSPSIDIGAVYIFYGSANSGFDDLNSSSADVTIRGDGLGHQFGWDVADAGDMNNDGVNDLIVGAPRALNGRGCAYIFYGGSFPTGSLTASTYASRTLTGASADGYYGSAVSGVGDIDSDGYDDVVVGAPGADEVAITYGYDKLFKTYPDIWDDDPGTPGIVDFSNGANNYINETYTDNNTWGRLAGDDGWDWIDAISDTTDRVYGHHVTTTPAHGTTIDLADCYGPWEPGGPDGDNLTRGNRSALQVIAGRTRKTSNPYGPSGSDDPMTSAAWGIEFNITSEMMDYISSNSTIKVSFNYESWDNEKVFNGGTTAGTEEICTVRSRIWNSMGKYYLGNIIKNNERYIFYHYQEYGTPEWATVTGSFEYDISEFIEGAGTYYWDFGCSFGSPNINQNNNDPDEGILTYFDDVSMVITNERTVRVLGLAGSGFGSALAGVGDIDSDGYSDVLIGAPGLDGGYAALFPGKQRYKSIDSVNLANIILTGKDDGDRFGSSVANAGDVDNDGVPDIIIGAPGGNYANVYLGSTLNAGPLVPDLWELGDDDSTPQLEFTSGLKTTGNTPGISGEDDGWDTYDGAYGYAGTSTKYNDANNPNSTNVANDKELLIGIGAHFGNNAKPDSGAYGVEFTVTEDMITTIQTGGEAVVSYDWYFENLELDSSETIWIKSHLRSDTKDLDLGWDLDEGAAGGNRDQTNEVHWSSVPENMNSVFIQHCTECLDCAGSFYLDFGGKIRAWSDTPTNIEDGIFHFDNVYLRINPAPDIQFIGPPESAFGFSVGYSDKLNIDAYGDILIGAPKYDSTNGNDSGAIFGFFDKLTTGKPNLAKNAEFVTYGEHAGDNFGWVLPDSICLDPDEYPEIVTSAINYNSKDKGNIGKIYMYSITKGPRIRLLYPVGGETLNGNITLNATVIDPDENVDNNYGVKFFFSTDLIEWDSIGKDKTPFSTANIYDHYWNTTQIPDSSNYYVKAWVRDLDLMVAENISSPIIIDNLHPPEIKINNPTPGEILAGTLEIQVLAIDSELDNLGGGINTTRGVQFYLSENQNSWELLGTQNSGEQDIYSLILDTTLYPDKEYWLKVNATDIDNIEVERTINITIDNPARAPNITLLSPTVKQVLKGKVTVMATAFDFDGDINSSGVSFYLSSDTKKGWQLIGNAPTPKLNDTGAHMYSMTWDTTTVPDDWYRLKAYVSDSEGLTNESISSVFMVHNLDTNPPSIQLISPRGGETLVETQILMARVRDLEGNIDTHGVDYYYSPDLSQWRLIGNSAEPRIGDNETYDFLWQTATVPDGEYWLNVSVSDTTSLTSWYVSDQPIFIHNSELNPPFVKILSPSCGQYINGTFNVHVSALDLENNIDSVGVIFYYSMDYEDWTVLSNVPSPLDTGGSIYEFSWDSAMHADGKYWLKAEASDYDGLKGEGYSEYFYIHNYLQNPPSVTYLGPGFGNLSGQVKLNASVFDLENNLDENGVKFYYSLDQDTWKLISSDLSGNPMEEQELYYEITWDTTLVSDDIYWLKAEAVDITNLIGTDISDSQVIVHNRMDNPPRIIFKTPTKGVPLAQLESIVVEVIDFENDVDSVAFYYTRDNNTWKLIGSRLKPEKDNVYKIVWNTEEVYNGEYYIKVIAKDKMGNQMELIEGPFEVKEGIKEAQKTKDELPAWVTMLIIIIIIIIIIGLISIFLLRRLKRREKELIEEVTAEMRETSAQKGKVVPVNGTGIAPTHTTGADVSKPTAESVQTYVPLIEGSPAMPGDRALTADRDFKDLAVEMVGSGPGEAPLLGTTPPSPGSTPELPAIDDMLPQLLPGTPSPDATEGAPEAPLAPALAAEQPEIPVSPFVEGKPQVEAAGDSEIPTSPFANAQTQTLEEEMGAETAVVELPVEPDVSLPEPENVPSGLEPEAKENKKTEDEKET